MRDDYALKYKEIDKYHWWFKARAKIIEDIIKGFLIEKNMSRKILDIGIAGEQIAGILKNYGKVIGIDNNKIILAVSKNENYSYILGMDILKPSLKKKMFSIITCLDVIEHLETPKLAMDNIYDLLAPGGYIFITVPAFQFLWGKQDIVNSHFKRYSKKELLKLIDKNKFDILRCSYFNFLLFLPIAIIKILTRFLADTKFNFFEKYKSDIEIDFPDFLNNLLFFIFSLEKYILRYINLSFGVSIFCVLKKKSI